MAGTRRSALVASGIALGAGAVIYLTVIQLFQLFSRTFALFPSPTVATMTTEHARTVEEALTETPTDLSGSDITMLSLKPNGAIATMDPFAEFARIGSSHAFKIAGVLLLVGLVALVLVSVLPRLRAWRPKTVDAVLATWASITAGFGLLFYVTKAGNGGWWDEIYVFATQARQFAQTGIAAVPTTGPRGMAESSADLGITLGAGVIMKLFPSLQAETTLVLTYVIFLIGLTLASMLALRNWFGFGRILSTLIPIFLVVLLPQGILATTDGVPTSVAAGALTVFALVLLHTLRSGSLVWFAIYAIPFGIIRWEYGIVAVGASAFILVTYVIRRRRGFAQPWRVRDWLLLSVPAGFLVVETAYRLIVFGTYAPSGVLAKGVGFNGSYIASGFTYLVTTAGVNLWPLMLAVAVATVLLARGWAGSVHYIVVCVFVTLPLFNSIIAGGDWFPNEWERYVTPSYAAVLMVTVAIFGGQFSRRERMRFALIPVAAVYLVTQFALVPAITNDFVTPGVHGRTNCLARASLAVARVVPPSEGIASAEVNTMAYFANAPVTDLSGLIEPRVALEQPTPLGPGDPFHRKSNPSIIYTDRPAAIYLYEGANCSGDATTADNEAARWNELLHSPITSFRAGSVTKLLTAYKPVSITVPGEVTVRMLIRNDLVE